MIVEAILVMFFGCISFVIQFLPTFSLGDELLNTFSSWLELIAVVKYFVPMNIFYMCATVFAAFHLYEFGVSIVNWLIGKIPTIT